MAIIFGEKTENNLSTNFSTSVSKLKFYPASLTHFSMYAIVIQCSLYDKTLSCRRHIFLVRAWNDLSSGILETHFVCVHTSILFLSLTMLTYTCIVCRVLSCNVAAKLEYWVKIASSCFNSFFYQFLQRAHFIIFHLIFHNNTPCATYIVVICLHLISSSKEPTDLIRSFIHKGNMHAHTLTMGFHHLQWWARDSFIGQTYSRLSFIKQTIVPVVVGSGESWYGRLCFFLINPMQGKSKSTIVFWWRQSRVYVIIKYIGMGTVICALKWNQRSICERRTRMIVAKHSKRSK